MPPSPIRKLVPFAEQAKKQGAPSIIKHRSTGHRDAGFHVDAIHHFAPKVVEYSHSAGIESYRKKLTTYYKRYQIELDYTDILITTGGSEAIEIAMMSCLTKVMRSSFRNPSMPTTTDFPPRHMSR